MPEGRPVEQEPVGEAPAETLNRLDDGHASDGTGLEEVGEVTRASIAKDPNVVARERLSQILGTADEAPSEEFQRFMDDVGKALIDGDVGAFVRVKDAMGTPPGIQEIHDFVERGGVPLIEAMRQAELFGHAGKELDPSSTLGRRWNDLLRDFETAATGDIRALRRAGINLGLPEREINKLIERAKNGENVVGSGYGLPGKPAGSGGSGGSGSEPSGSAGSQPVDLREPTQRPEARIPELREGSGDGSDDAGSGGDSDAPPTRDDPDPGTSDGTGGGDEPGSGRVPDVVNAPSSGSKSGGSSATVEVGQGSTVPGADEGASSTTDANGNTTVYYPDGRVEVYDANGNLIRSWRWDPKKVEDAGESRPTDDAPASGPIADRASILLPDGQPPKQLGYGPDHVDPALDDYAGGPDPFGVGNVIVTGPGYVDPPRDVVEESNGGRGPDPGRGPDYDPDHTDEHGPIVPDLSVEHVSEGSILEGGGVPAPPPARGGIGRTGKIAAVVVGIGVLLGAGILIGREVGGRDNAPTRITEPGGREERSTDADADFPGEDDPAGSTDGDAPAGRTDGGTTSGTTGGSGTSTDGTSGQTNPDTGSTSSTGGTSSGSQSGGTSQDGIDPTDAEQFENEGPTIPDEGSGGTGGQPDPNDGQPFEGDGPTTPNEGQGPSEPEIN